MSLSLTTGKEYREKLEPLKVQLRQLADKANDPNYVWTAEDEKRWKDINAEYDHTKEQAIRLSRVDDIEKELQGRASDEPKPGREDYDGRRAMKEHDVERHAQASPEDHGLATQAWFREQSGLDLAEKHVEACRRLNFNPRRRTLDLGIENDYRQVRQQFGANAKMLGGARQERTSR